MAELIKLGQDRPVFLSYVEPEQGWLAPGQGWLTMPEVVWKRQCSEEEDSITPKLTQEFQKQRPQSAPLPNFNELLEKLKVRIYIQLRLTCLA